MLIASLSISTVPKNFSSSDNLNVAKPKTFTFTLKQLGKTVINTGYLITEILKLGIAW